MSSITRDAPYSSAYNFYGDPYKLVEFRMMVLNHCSMDCKGCFYKRTENNFNDFASARNLAEDMIANHYKMETCYLLPTDMFDNPDNYLLFDNEDFKETVNKFSFVGIASTLELGYDPKFFDIIYSLNDTVAVELQVNLSIKRLFNDRYQDIIKENILRLKEAYGDRIIINLAINAGFKITDEEYKKIDQMTHIMSEDGIVEVNFTFLYNPTITEDKQKEMLRTALGTVNYFGSRYETHESFETKFNHRTFLRKPSFVFINGDDDTPKIYVNPIVPFDEYVFIKKDRYLLETASYDAFLNSYGAMSEINNTIIKECDTCEYLTHCMGKHYFNIANEFDLGCFLKIKD